VSFDFFKIQVFTTPKPPIKIAWGVQKFNLKLNRKAVDNFWFKTKSERLPIR